MFKVLAVSCLLVLITSCNENPDCTDQTGTIQKSETTPVKVCPTPDPNPDPEPVPEPVPGEVPEEALIFDAQYKLTNFDSVDEAKLQAAVEIIKKVIASEEFRTKVLNFTYEGKKQFVDNKGMTNAQIYQALLNGSEDLSPGINHVMDLDLELYYDWRSTVGYTYPGVTTIYMNTKFFDPFTPSEVAGNVFHEWTHKLGFEHSSSYSVSRDSTVPYAVGNLIVELGKKYE